jgi:hypothetical protein
MNEMVNLIPTYSLTKNYSRMILLNTEKQCIEGGWWEEGREGGRRRRRRRRRRRSLWV